MTLTEKSNETKTTDVLDKKIEQLDDRIEAAESEVMDSSKERKERAKAFNDLMDDVARTN